MKYIERKHKLLKSLSKTKSLLVLGPRGAGKSLYISKLINDILASDKLEIDLLKTDLFKKYLRSPSFLREEINFKLERTNQLLVFIDEIQKVPALLDEVHHLMEKYKGHINFILTGSSARKLKKEKANLLAGRAIYAPFVTLSFEEINFTNNLTNILQFGLLPEVYTEDDLEMKIRFLKSYTGTYLKEEIMQEAIVKNIDGFNTFLEIAASVNGSPVNYSKMSRQVNISDQSIKGHYQILEDTLWAYKISAWTYSKKKQLQKAPKYHFFDNGVLNALRGELKVELKESSYRYGELFENLVVGEIIKYNILKEFDYNIFHFRTLQGEEIDLVIQAGVNSPPIAVEIKSAISPDVKEIKSLIKFKNDYPRSKCIVLCRTDTSYIRSGIEFYPFLEGIKEIFS